MYYGDVVSLPRGTTTAVATSTLNRRYKWPANIFAPVQRVKSLYQNVNSIKKIQGFVETENYVISKCLVYLAQTKSE